MDDLTLIRRALGGDLAAWEPLIAAHEEAVFRLAYLFLGDPDEAADVAQETFVRAWRHLNHFDVNRSLRPWLLSIAANLARNQRRSAGRYLAALTRALRADPRLPKNVEEKSTQHQQANELWKAVQVLNSMDQQIIYLRYFLDLSMDETAQVLEIAAGTVKSRLSRALVKLRAIIRQDFPDLNEGFDA